MDRSKAALHSKPGASQRARDARRPRSDAALGDYDTQLMLQAARGDPEAATALVRRNFALVSRYVARVVRDARAVEDLAQDVFVQVLTTAPRYTPSARFSTWLYRIATNAALNYLKQAQIARRAGDPDGIGMELVDRHEPPPDGRISLDELKHRVSEAIGSLPVNQRVALVLFEYENLSYQQIAAVLEVTVEGVRALLTRARATLRTKLQAYV
jgi:RNA polymerase sigma-70 factor (ECF subfamily)